MTAFVVVEDSFAEEDEEDEPDEAESEDESPEDALFELEAEVRLDFDFESLW